jgi:hypothetical protein
MQTKNLREIINIDNNEQRIIVYSINHVQEVTVSRLRDFLAWSFWSRAELHAELYLNFCLNFCLNFV